jgi:hypothetical protein
LPASATIPAITATAEPSTASASAAFARRHRASFVHCERPAIKIGAIEFRNGVCCLLFRRHFDEAKAFTAPSIPIGNDSRRFNLAGLCKHLSQAVIGGRKRKISNVKFVTHILL